MKKQTRWSILLLVLIVAAVAIEIYPGSVIVWDAEQVQKYPYLYANPDVAAGICPALAALVSYITFALAIVYLISKKPGWVKAVGITAFLAALLAVIPIFLSGSERRMLPNVGVPLAMCGVCLIARYLAKQPAAEKTEKVGSGRRLPPR